MTSRTRSTGVLMGLTVDACCDFRNFMPEYESCPGGCSIEAVLSWLSDIGTGISSEEGEGYEHRRNPG